MRDKHDTGTGDIFDIPDRAIRPRGATDRHYPGVLTYSSRARVKPRVRVQGTCLTLVDHPALAPIGFAELKRLGDIPAVLADRIHHHSTMAGRRTYQKTFELPVPTTAEGMRHLILAYRYNDALGEFVRLARR